jgi:plasmid stabilization system protein ParE
MKVLISQRAEDDLARIYGHIAARNPEAAERFRTERNERWLSWASSPNWGHAPAGKHVTVVCDSGSSAGSTII